MHTRMLNQMHTWCLALVKRTQITACTALIDTHTQQYARTICTPTLFCPRLLPCLTDHRAVADVAPILCRLSRVSDLHVIRTYAAQRKLSPCGVHARRTLDLGSLESIRGHEIIRSRGWARLGHYRRYCLIACARIL